MRRRWVRGELDRRDEVAAALAAGVVATGVGLATYYLTRLLLSREDPPGPPGLPAGDEVGRLGDGGA